MECELVQYFELSKYHIKDEEFIGMLLDYVYAPESVKTVVINQLSRRQTVKWPACQNFMNSLHEFIINVNEYHSRLTLKEHPEFDPDFYTVPNEEIERSNQFDIDVINAIYSNWSLEYRIERLKHV